MNVDHNNLAPQTFQRREWRIPPGRYHRILQVLGNLQLSDGSSQQEVMAAARARAIKWLELKKNISVPNAVKNGDSWDFEPDDSTRTLTIETSPGLWAMRLDDPCGEIPGRMWRVEFAVAETKEGQPALGCTLSVLLPQGVDTTVSPSIPALVLDIANHIGLYDDGRELHGVPWDVERPIDIEKLISLIENRGRNRAVIVITTSEHRGDFVDAAKVARDLAGLAHVVTIDASAAFDLTKRFGKQLSVFGGAVRLYRTSFDADNDSQFRHPLFRADRWRDRVHSLYWALKFDAVQETLSRPDEARDMPSFGLIRRVAAEQRLRQAIKAPTNNGPNFDEIKRDLDRLQEDSNTWQALAFEEERRRKNAEEALEEAKRRSWQYSARIRQLEQEREDAGYTPVPIDWPNSFDELGEWAENHLLGRVAIAPKAIKAARRSVFLDTPAAYRALHHLATAYWKMRVEGGNELKNSCTEAEMKLGLERKRVGDALRNPRVRDQYWVTYEGHEYECDQHLVGGDSRNEQHCLRIYFAWDEVEQLVIVGHLPTHLDNSLT